MGKFTLVGLFFLFLLLMAFSFVLFSGFNLPVTKTIAGKATGQPDWQEYTSQITSIRAQERLNIAAKNTAARPNYLAFQDIPSASFLYANLAARPNYLAFQEDAADANAGDVTEPEIGGVADVGAGEGAEAEAEAVVDVLEGGEAEPPADVNAAGAGEEVVEAEAEPAVEAVEEPPAAPSPPLVVFVYPLEFQTISGIDVIVVSITNFEEITANWISINGTDFNGMVSGTSITAELDTSAFGNGMYDLSANACTADNCYSSSIKVSISNLPGIEPETGEPAAVAEEEAVVLYSIVPSTVSAALSFFDANGGLVASGSEEVVVGGGVYDAGLVFLDGDSVVGGVEFEGVVVDGNGVLLGVAEGVGFGGPEPWLEWVGGVVFNPGFSFSRGSAVLKAPIGSSGLFKCSDWDSGLGLCNVEWEKIQLVGEAETVSVELLPQGHAYGFAKETPPEPVVTVEEPAADVSIGGPADLNVVGPADLNLPDLNVVDLNALAPLDLNLVAPDLSVVDVNADLNADLNMLPPLDLNFVLPDFNVDLNVLVADLNLPDFNVDLNVLVPFVAPLVIPVTPLVVPLVVPFVDLNLLVPFVGALGRPAADVNVVGKAPVDLNLVAPDLNVVDVNVGPVVDLNALAPLDLNLVAPDLNVVDLNADLNMLVPLVVAEEEAVVLYSIVPSTVSAALSFFDANGGLVASGSEEVVVGGGVYDAGLVFLDGDSVVGGVEFEGVVVDGNGVLLGVAEGVGFGGPEPWLEWVGGVVFNPGFSFSRGSAVLKAPIGSSGLFKCSDWDSGLGLCNVEWEKIQLVGEAETVSVELLPAGHAYGFAKQSEDNPKIKITGKKEFLLRQNVKFDIEVQGLDTIAKDEADDNAISVFLGGPREEELTAKEITDLGEGNFKISLKWGRWKREFTPGIYRLVVETDDNGETVEQEFPFNWGLVALNTRKSIYRPGEKAEFIIVVLNSAGSPVCGADINLTVEEPDGDETVLSTAAGTITAGTVCGLYDAEFMTEIEGTHDIKVSAVAAGVSSTFKTDFLVKESYDFDIIRTADTKIDPTTGNSFTVRIDINSFIAVSSIQLEERVPPVFNVTTDATIEETADAKVLLWDKELVEGKTFVEYSYSVPLEWPVLYELGEAEIYYADGNFTEARPWYVAVDPQKSSVFSATHPNDFNYSEPAPNDAVTGDTFVGTSIQTFFGMHPFRPTPVENVRKVTGTTTVGNYKGLTWVSPPLAAQTIPSGTWTFYYSARELSTSDNLRLRASIMVWSDSNDSKAANISMFKGTSSELSTTWAAEDASASISMNGDAVTINDRDKLILEIDFNATSSTLSTSGIDLNFNQRLRRGELDAPSGYNLILFDGQQTGSLYARRQKDYNYSEPAPNDAVTGDTFVGTSIQSFVAMVPERGGGNQPIGDRKTTGTTTVGNYKGLTWVSPPLAAQTIPSGTWTLNVWAREDSTSDNLRLRASIMVWSDSNDSKAANIKMFAGTLSELSTTLTKYTITMPSGNQVTLSKRDKLIVEIDFNATTSTLSTSRCDMNWNIRDALNLDGNIIAPIDINLFAANRAPEINIPSSDNNTGIAVGVNFLVKATVRCDGNYFDCGPTDVNMQWCKNAGCTTWADVNSSSGAIQLVSGQHPARIWDFNVGDVNSSVSWVLQAKEAGTYELRVTSKSSNTDANSSSGTDRTITAAVVNFPDVNVAAIDSNPDNQALPRFDYLKDGNLTIDFNVMDLDGNTLLVDINYSASNVEGTGSVIIDDVNTVNLSCVDSDFTNPTKCSVDWNIMGVSPGTYYVLVKVSDGSYTDFNVSDNNFAVVALPKITIALPVNGSTTMSKTVTFDVNVHSVWGFDVNRSGIKVYVDGSPSSVFNPVSHCTASSASVLYAGTRPYGDVFRSIDGSASWLKTGDLSGAEEVWDLLYVDGNLYAGTYPNGNVFKSTDGGATWVNTGDLSGAAIVYYIIRTPDGNLYAGTGWNGDVFKSTNAGSSWSNTGDLTSVSDVYSLLYADGNFYAGTGNTTGDVFKSSNGGTSWSNTGDLTGATRVFSLLSVDGNLFAGTYPNGDVFKSSNGGTSWSNTGDLTSAVRVDALLYVDGNLFAGTGWGGDVFKSTNGGTSWSNTADLTGVDTVYSLLYVDGALYAGTSQDGEDVFKSTDGGASWVVGGDLSGATYIDALVSQDVNSYHCSYTETGLSVGKDYNVTVFASNTGQTDVDQNSTIFTFVVPAPDVNVVAIDSNPDNQVLPRFDYLKDGNLTIDFNVMDLDGNTLLVDVNYSSSKVEGTGTVIINDVNTVNLSCVDSDFTNPTKCSVDWNIMGVSPGTYYVLVKVSDGSYTDFNASDNNFVIVALPKITIALPVNGSTTSSKTVTFDVNRHSVWGFDVNRTAIKVYVDGSPSSVFNPVSHCTASSASVLYAGTGYNGDVFRSIDGGASWLNSGDLSGAEIVFSLLYVDGNLFAGTGVIYGDVFRSIDGGASWLNSGDLSGAERVLSLLYVDGNLFAGTAYNGDVFKSTNGGTSWSNTGDLSGADKVYSLLSVDGNLFAGTYPDGNVFKSTNGGTTWVNTGDLSGATIVYSIIRTPDGNLYAGTGYNGDVFKSTDAGASWSNTGDLTGASDAYSLLYVDGNLYAATTPNGNVFKSSNGGTSWVNTGDLSGAEYVDALLYVGGNLYAGTYPDGNVFKSSNGGTTWANTGDLTDATDVYSLLSVDANSYHCSYTETGLSVGKDYNVTVFASNTGQTDVDQNSSIFTFVVFAPDVNVVAIDSNPDNQVLPRFDYLKDGNLTIDFNVMDLDGNTLLVDINYSASNVEGTGTVIVNDVNTVNLSCVDSDFTNPTKCSVDWNIMGVSPGTYYVLVKVSDGSYTDFNVSDNNFAVVALPKITIALPVNGSTTSSKTVTFDVNRHSVWGFDVNRSGIKVYVDGAPSSVFNPVSHCTASSTSMLYAGTSYNGDVFRSIDGGASWLNSGDLSGAEIVFSLLSVDGNLYAGTTGIGIGGAVFRSINGGATWVNTGDLAGAIDVYSLLSVDGNLYAGTGWSGDVFKSTDAGATWVNTGNLSSALYVFSLLYVDGNLYAGTAGVGIGGAVFKSTNGGTTWVNTGDLNGATSVDDLLSVDGNLYAGTYPDGNVFKSTDGGTSWSFTGDLSGAEEVYSLLYVDGNLYAGTGTTNGDVFKSSDNGATWVNTGNLSGAEYVYSLLSVDANSYHCSYTETGLSVAKDYNVTVFASNTGQIDVDQNSTIFTFVVPAPDVNVVAIDSNPDNQVLPRFDYLKDGNLTIDFNVMDLDGNTLLVDINYSSSNVEGTGTAIINDVNTVNLSCVDSDFTNPTKCSVDWNIMGVSPGTYYVLVKVSDGSYTDFDVSDNNFAVVALPKITIALPVNGSTTMSKTVTFDVNRHSVWGFDVNRTAIKVYVDGSPSSVFNPVSHCTASSTSVLYAGPLTTDGNYYYGYIFRSIDGGASWLHSDDLNGVMSLNSLLYSDGNLFAGTGLNGDVFKSTNTGATWLNTGDLSGATSVDSLLYVDGNLYAGTYPNGDVFKSSDAGATWLNTGDLSGATDVFSLLYVDGNLYAGTYPNGDVFKSSDAGATWLNTGDLSGATDVFSLLYVDGNLFAGTAPNGDVFKSTDGGTSWSNTGDLSGATYVYSLLYVDGNLYAGTGPTYGDVFKSTNGGTSWVNTGDLSGAINTSSLLYVDGNLYAGTSPSGDVFKSTNGGTSWSNTGDLTDATDVYSLLSVDANSYHCSYTETGLSVAKDYNITVFASNTGQTDVDQNSSIFTFVVADYSFALSLPASGCTEGKGSIDASPDCEIAYFETTDLSGLALQYKVDAEGQTSAIYFFVFDNQSTASSDLNITMDLNALPPSTLAAKVSKIYSGWDTSCSGNTDTNCVELSATAQNVGKAPYSAGTQDLNLFIWGDFLSAPAYTSEDRNVTSTSIAP